MGIETAYCACTTDKTKTRVQMSGKFAHTMRLHEVKNADPEKRGLNEVLIGDDTIRDVFAVSLTEAKQKSKAHEYKTYEDYAEETKWMVEAATGKRVRKDAVLEVEVVLTYSSSAIDSIPIDEWKAANVQWLKDYFGEDNVVSAVLHMDETTPHIHAMVTPIDRDSGQPKFNAKKWLGGRALMSQMQTSYGDAMKQFGLKRGEQNSRASHQDLQTFYRALNNVVRQKLPERSQFQDDQSYQEAIDVIYKENVVRMFALEQAIKRLEDVDKTRESNNSIYRDMTEARIKDYEEQIKVLQSDLSESEKKAKFVDNMQAAISSIERNDPDKANQIRENLNNLSRKGGRVVEALARKKSQDSEQTPDQG
jgi:hypothetical protein